MTRPVRDAFCSFCGTRHTVLVYPRTCGGCGVPTYANPSPVSVVLIPANQGLVVVRRTAPGKGHGMLALPGGYQNLGESWQQACAREALEETGLVIDPAQIVSFDTKTDPPGHHTMTYGLAPAIQGTVDLSALTHDSEVSEIAIIHDGFSDLAFSTHTEVARRYFRSINPSWF